MLKIAIAASLLLPVVADLSFAASADMLMYVGGYTNRASGAGKGIYLFKLSPDQKLTPIGLAAQTPNPSFLALDEKRRLMFSVSEMAGGPGGKPAGAVSSFAIQPDGTLKLLSTKSSAGAGPCYVAIDRDAKNLFVANYGSGSVAMLPISSDGQLGDATDFKQFEGSGPNPDRQKGPHAHCATFDPAGERLFVCDLGTDKVMIYKPTEGKLVPNDPPFATVPPGSGPRHIAFRPDARFAYVINEVRSTATTFAYDAKTGAMKEVETISILPDSYKGQNTAAEIVVHPGGKSLYASNRGDDAVMAYAIDADKGTLKFISRTSTGGKVPRFFGLDPSGAFLVMCNQNSNNMETATVDAGTGELTVKDLIDTPAPTCAVFLPSADH
jgi:6-phosphogluconolactonase